MATSTSTSTSTSTRSRAKPGAGAEEPRQVPSRDARARFRWLDDNQATVVYQGDECLISVGVRKTPFRGRGLAEAVLEGMKAIAPKAGASGTRTSGPRSRAAGK